ncbi:L,D-transpeptidase [Thiomicrorhabdus lithotrophica]|uniref:L,D-transpeptidase n=1 Tax=Thiomicrorhabdus lithotrophica TaxID=2949997 RepID=A0ABY8C8N6_9GAMM|nr:L,D-transpeptidase [Thiomicrorhabdus lithotrophica]WEJ61592.1 L,D-transpeptidase [Thiomicrorhabdus lithotrophica]
MSYSLRVSISEQTLELFNNEELVKAYSISTALNGSGCQKDSGQTPLGKHIIRAKIGANTPINSVFVGRRPTGEIFNEQLAQEFPHRDWILSRILWLSGNEKGVNRLGNVDTMQRYIYIHGTPDSEPMGVPISHGCIRMRNNEIIELFDLIEIQTPVEIIA